MFINKTVLHILFLDILATHYFLFNLNKHIKKVKNTFELDELEEGDIISMDEKRPTRLKKTINRDKVQKDRLRVYKKYPEKGKIIVTDGINKFELYAEDLKLVIRINKNNSKSDDLGETTT